MFWKQIVERPCKHGSGYRGSHTTARIFDDDNGDDGDNGDDDDDGDDEQVDDYHSVSPDPLSLELHAFAEKCD